MITAGVAPLVPLRVGMRFGSWAELPPGLPIRALLLDATEYPLTPTEAYNMASTACEYTNDDGVFPLTLLYLPRSYRGPVEGAEDDVDGTESAGGQVVADEGDEALAGYGALMLMWAGEHKKAGQRDFATALTLAANYITDAVIPARKRGRAWTPDTEIPTQEGYRQMMRQKSMAAHPAGKGMAIGDSRDIFDGGDALGPELDLLAYYPADRGRV